MQSIWIRTWWIFHKISTRYQLRTKNLPGTWNKRRPYYVFFNNLFFCVDRPDGNSQLIRLSSPGSGTKFASISAKVKAKQLARWVEDVIQPFIIQGTIVESAREENVWIFLPSEKSSVSVRFVTLNQRWLTASLWIGWILCEHIKRMMAKTTKMGG